MNLKEQIELASRGNADAQYKVGKLYLLGDFVIQSNKTAIELFRRAAEQGHKSAEIELDALLHQLYNIPQTPNKKVICTTATDDKNPKTVAEDTLDNSAIINNVESVNDNKIKNPEKEESIREATSENSDGDTLEVQWNETELIYKRDDPVIVELAQNESKIIQREAHTKQHKRGEPLGLNDPLIETKKTNHNLTSSHNKYDDELIFNIIGSITSVTTFLGCWIYAIATYGWFLGIALGWIPSLIIAYLAFALRHLILLAFFVGILIYFLSSN